MRSANGIEKRHLFIVSLTVAVLVGEMPRPTFSICDSYLVDPASSHMLVSKIKPCMSKYK
ncbi:hypothetical protein K501DRAFT_18861 [Backusella circina FSU 941]|nr:hypothetical protein K501DRAFT_18861 [Backusella circina FSU 941]